MANRVRPDIQALRAMAVLVVMLYHFWPGGPFSGGYVGVDVFFVISGYLITGHLIRTAEDGTFRFRDFWLRRARRLLPASLVVLMVCTGVTLMLAPLPMWRATFEQVVASALFFENIALTLNSVDYLAENALATPVQHFWSLSLEEQFYLVWPVLLIGTFALGRKSRRSELFVTVTVVSVFCLSFALSVVVTPVLPGPAYFLPVTRAWEFAVGAIVFLAGRRMDIHTPFRAILALAGIAAIVTAVFAFDERTLFPGSAAAIPVLGTALVIFARADSGTVGAMFAWGPVQRLGAISYSAYLWHWPLTVFVFVGIRSIGAEFPPWALVAPLLFLGILMGGLSKRYIEDAALQVRSPKRNPGRVLFGLAAATALVVASGVASWDRSNSAIANAAERATSLAIAVGDCGSDQTFATCDPDEILLPAAVAQQDLPPTYALGCQAGPRESELIRCDFNESARGKRVALVGDSHAASWHPALMAVAERNDWSMSTFLKSSCSWSEHQVDDDVLQRASCLEWNERLDTTLETAGYDLIITSYFDRSTPRSLNAQVRGLVDAWSPLAQSGAEVVAIVDTPTISSDSAACLFASRRDPSLCVEAEPEMAAPSALAEAAHEVPRTRAIDMSDEFATPDGKIDTVSEGVVIWRDTHHFTATYSASLAERLAAELRSD